jgi:hypothetical protein
VQTRVCRADAALLLRCHTSDEVRLGFAGTYSHALCEPGVRGTQPRTCGNLQLLLFCFLPPSPYNSTEVLLDARVQTPMGLLYGAAAPGRSAAGQVLLAAGAKRRGGPAVHPAQRSPARTRCRRRQPRRGPSRRRLLRRQRTLQPRQRRQRRRGLDCGGLCHRRSSTPRPGTRPRCRPPPNHNPTRACCTLLAASRPPECPWT